jgi:transcriptional regulator with XRE-family HTH domain
MAKTAPYLEDREVVRLWLRRRYEREEFNQHKLAKAVGVSQAGVSRWIRDGVPVPPKYWPAMAAFFEFPSVEALIAAARTKAAMSAR